MMTTQQTPAQHVTETIRLDEWYNVRQATERLSLNTGRHVGRHYPRTLAKYGLVRMLDIGTRGKLYFAPDIDSYVVTHRHGRKRRPRVSAPTQEKE